MRRASPGSRFEPGGPASDGRTSALRQAIAAHAGEGSEANGVIRRFIALPESQQQDLLNFLGSPLKQSSDRHWVACHLHG